MKTKTILLAFCLFCCAPLAHAQTNVYHPFPDSNAVWRERNNYLSNRYYMDGDTMIGSNLYKAIYKEFNYVYPLTLYINDIPLTYFGGYIGGLRDDTINKKVYFVFRDSTNERLLYDFSTTSGYLQGLVAEQALFSLVLDDIDSIQIGAYYHKRFNYHHLVDNNPDTPGFFIEGVGSNAGLFEIKDDDPWPWPDLVCFSVNDSILYPDTATAWSCDSDFTVPVQPRYLKPLRVYPNPTGGSFILEAGAELRTAGIQVYCYDALGRRQRWRYRRVGRQLLFKGNHNPGIYYLKVCIHGRIPLMQKIIVIK